MPNQPKTPARTVRVDDELWDAARREAEAKGENVSDIVRKALRKYLGLALVAMLALSACSAANAQPAPKVEAKAVAVTSPQKFTAETAQEFAAITGGTPLRVESRWDCAQPMRISIAAAPGWSGEQVYNDMLYAVSYLQALGYDVAVVGPTTYKSNMNDVPTTPGAITVAVAPNRSDQTRLANAVGITRSSDSGDSALILLDASRGGLLPDVILHEFGHVLGLDHREAGTVMSQGWDNSGHFDADETATVVCH
jgi:hypothetical protein